MSNWSYRHGSARRDPGGLSAFGVTSAGTWHEITASTPFDVDYVEMAIWGNTSGTWTIGLGSGTPTTITDAIITANGEMKTTRLPLSVRKGTKISINSNVGGYWDGHVVNAGGGGLNGWKSFRALGTVTTSGSAWGQISASTPYDALALMVICNSSNTLVQVGVGASGSQVEIDRKRFYFSGGNENPILDVPVPKGTNLWVKAGGARVQILALM